MSSSPLLPSAVLPDHTAALAGVLERYWGYTAFRPLQQAAMEAVLAGRDSVVVMPTGAGKSLCFQAPALVRPGLALVVSPLISLMKDQVDTLVGNGVAAACYNSALGPSQKAEVLDSLVEKGFARVIQEKTKLFSAVEPTLAIPSYLARRRQTLDQELTDQNRHASGLIEDLKTMYAEGQGGRGTLDFLRIVAEPAQAWRGPGHLAPSAAATRRLAGGARRRFHGPGAPRPGPGPGAGSSGGGCGIARGPGPVAGSVGRRTAPCSECPE